MGREAKFLLAILGLLAGVFVGVLSMKLLVPRPPAGAGPDIHDEVAAITPAAIVEPPALTPPQPLRDSVEPPAQMADRYPASRSVFAQASGDASESPAPTEPARDPFVARASFDQPQPPAELVVEDATPIERADPSARLVEPTSPAARALPVEAATYVPPAVPMPAARDASPYVAADGDSWWLVAEKTYGDGRLYRALFAWNRAINPRVSLVPGTPLELPPREKLAAAWPALMPRD